MKRKINSTRQELLRTKKRLKTARRGHALLEEKLEGLMREFLRSIAEFRRTSEMLEQKLPPALFSFFCFHNRMGGEKVDALLGHFPLAEACFDEINIMGVKISESKIKNLSTLREAKISSLLTDGYLYQAQEEISQNIPNLLCYGNLMIAIRVLAAEIEKTRRRANALEYVYIPELDRVKKQISQKLEERERFSRIVNLKLKALVEAK